MAEEEGEYLVCLGLKIDVRECIGEQQRSCVVGADEGDLDVGVVRGGVRPLIDLAVLDGAELLEEARILGVLILDKLKVAGVEDDDVGVPREDLLAVYLNAVGAFNDAGGSVVRVDGSENCVVGVNAFDAVSAAEGGGGAENEGLVLIGDVLGARVEVGETVVHEGDDLLGAFGYAAGIAEYAKRQLVVLAEQGALRGGDDGAAKLLFDGVDDVLLIGAEDYIGIGLKNDFRQNFAVAAG